MDDPARRDDLLSRHREALLEACRRLCEAAREERARAAWIVAESRRVRALAEALARRPG
jgi:hypothetical protein